MTDGGEGGTLDRDAQRLAELGYKQELTRVWSKFSNFAISFTIISVLAGCFTTYPQAWNLGGPIAISWGWPIVCLIVLTVAFSMSEVASAYPTAGGPYWWANELGGKGWRGSRVGSTCSDWSPSWPRWTGSAPSSLRPCSTSGASTSS